MRWEQDAGTSPCCAGDDRYEVPLLRASERAGDPDGVRLAGRYSVHFTPLNYDGKTDLKVWTLKPQCAIFACRSTTGHRDLFRYDAPDRY